MTRAGVDDAGDILGISREDISDISGTHASDISADISGGYLGGHTLRTRYLGDTRFEIDGG